MRFSILVLLMIKKSEQGVAFYNESSDQGDVLSCVNRIVKRHFDREHQVTILTSGSKDYVKGMESTVRLIANTSNDKLGEMSWFSQTEQAVVFLDGDFRRDFNVLMSLGTFHPRSRFLIVCTIGDTSLSAKSYLINVVQHLHENQRWVAAIALKSITGTTRIYGYTKTAHGNCGNPEILSFGKCSNDDSVSRLFPINVNYNQCPIRLATFDWSPLRKFVRVNGQKKSFGIESNIIYAIVDRLNASALFIEAPPSEIREVVGNHGIDIGYGQMSMYDTDNYIYTTSYSSVQGSVLMPKLSSEGRLGLNNLTPFESTVWIALILLVIFVIILRTLLPIFGVISMLNTFALFMGLGVRARLTHISQRMYFISLILFGYVIAQAYLANLTMIFTKANDKAEIESLEELEKSKLLIGGALSSAKFFEKSYPRLYRHYKGMDLTEFKQNLARLKTGNDGLATYVEVSKYINYKHWKYVSMMSEIISWYPVSMLLPKATTILSTCDWTISAFFEAGLMDSCSEIPNYQKLAADATDEWADNEKRINLQQFLKIFRLLEMGLGLSTVIFMIELSVAYWRTRRG